MNHRNIFLAFLMVVVSSSQAEAQFREIDQKSELRVSSGGWAISDRNAQTVTVGISGTLAEVGVQITQSNARAPGDLWVEIYNVNGDGSPNTSGQPLAAVLLSNSEIPLQQDVDDNGPVFTFANFLSSGLNFSAGDQFAIVLNRTVQTNTGTSPWMLWNTSASDYSRGSFYLDVIGGWDPRTSDHGFQTIMDVPEPIILGDVNDDDVVDFLDIGPFISALSTGEFLHAADIDGNDDVNFLDVNPFITILSGL